MNVTGIKTETVLSMKIPEKNQVNFKCRGNNVFLQFKAVN